MVKSEFFEKFSKNYRTMREGSQDPRGQGRQKQHARTMNEDKGSQTLNPKPEIRLGRGFRLRLHYAGQDGGQVRNKSKVQIFKRIW